MSKKLFTNELLIGISAMIISLSTLIVFIYQTNLIRKQQYKSVYPHLNLIHMYTGSANYAFTLRNQGIGPAILKSIEIKDEKGNSYEDLNEYLSSKRTEKDSFMLSYTDIAPGTLIQEKEEVALFKFSTHYKREISNDEMWRVRKLLDEEQLKLTLTYESIYEESWTIKSGFTIPVKN